MSSSSRVLSSRSASARTPRHGYKTISPRSEVDELLFTSHNSVSKDDKFDPRWKPFESTEKTKPPLLWAPTPSKNMKNVEKSSFKRKYVPVKMVPSFVDETLFGPKIKDPDFPAPWDKPKKKPVLLWSPVSPTFKTDDQKVSNINKRLQTPTLARNSNPVKPVWRP